MENAKVQIYTGQGKGKTTAAFGLCLRALGHGMNAFVVQFRKGMDSGERVTADVIGLPVLLCEEGRKSAPCSEPCRLLAEIDNIIKHKRPDIIVLDEIAAAIRNGCVTAGEVISILDEAGRRVEIVLTGRGIPAELLTRADLVTSMEPLRHYAERGVKARKGVEY